MGWNINDSFIAIIFLLLIATNPFIVLAVIDDRKKQLGIDSKQYSQDLENNNEH